MGPTEGAQYMGLENLYFIKYAGRPTISEYDAYAQDMAPMKRVIWSLTGMGGETSGADRAAVLKLAADYGNIRGFILDDFLHWSGGDDAPAQWLAANHVDFPVTLTLTGPAPVACETLELRQTDWSSGDYRSKGYVVEVREGTDQGAPWRKVYQGEMPNLPAGMGTAKVGVEQLTGLRVTLLGTYDADELAQSCGLKGLRLYCKGEPVDVSGWKATASSEFSEEHGARHVLGSSKTGENSAPLPAAMTPEELRQLRQETVVNGERLPIVCVVYTNQISPRMLPHVNEVDKVAVWTWFGKDLEHLETEFVKLEKVVGDKPILLGCYLYDYGVHKALPVEWMKHQCELGLKWLKEGRIEGMIFLATNVVDIDLEAVEWTREWIKQVGDEPLGR